MAGSAQNVTASPRLEWPDEVRDGISRWQVAQQVELTLEQWLTGGRTAAQVAVATVTGEGIPPRRLIVKLCPPADGAPREPLSHRAALREAPREFREAHLVTQPFDPLFLESDWWVMFQDVAGGSLRRMRPIAALVDSEALPTVAEVVITALLEGWNPTPQLLRTPPRQFVRSIIGARYDGDGTLHRFSDEAGIDSTHEAVGFGSGLRLLPNPLNWLSTSAEEVGSLLALTGNGHGDLNLNNVLVELGVGVDAASFRLIDLSTYSGEAPLTRDPCHLLLAVVAEHLHEFTNTQRLALFESVLGAWKMPGDGFLPDQPDSLRLTGLNRVASAVAEPGRVWAARSGFEDEWRDQSLLTLVGIAAFYATLGALTADQRRWFFELSCRALEEHLRQSDRGALAALTSSAAITQHVGGPAPAPTTLEAAEALDAACSRFDGSITPVVILSPSFAGDGAERLLDSPWRLVVDFNPSTDVSGAYSRAKNASVSSRLVTVGQQAHFGRGTTTWLAAAGLGDAQLSGFREWRNHFLPTIQETFDSLAASASTPIVAVVLGEADSFVRAAVEAAIDAADQRTTVLHVSPSPSNQLGEYDASHIAATASEVLRSLPNRNAGPAPARSRTIPGLDGPLAISDARLAWLEEAGDVLHSDVATEVWGTETPGKTFYRGRQISWLELDVAIDVDRPISGEVLDRVRADLELRATRRISLHHYPGAGGTTVGRRVAWDLHRYFPVLVVSQIHDAMAVASRVRELSEQSGLAVLVVLDLTGENIVEAIYSSLRAASVPCVFLIVGRRTSGHADERSDRAFYLGPIQRANDRLEFARRYARQVPHREEALQRFASRPGSLGVPFFFGLVAFEEAFEGLDDYVTHTRVALDDAETDALIMIALVHRFAGLSTPEPLLSSSFGVSYAPTFAVETRLSESARALLIQDRPGVWRTAHWLVGKELLEQALRPKMSVPRDEWRTALSAWAVRLIQRTADVFGAHIPLDVRDILDRLFIERDSQDVLGTERTSFSELLSEVPSVHGRLEVLRTLAHTFPAEAHFWAHLGRLLSYELREHDEALEAVDKALALSPDDDVIHHVRGMVFRNKARALMGPGVASRDHEDEILDLVDLACAEFAQASALEDTSEYGYVATAQICSRAIEHGKALRHDDTFGAFLARPDAARYRALLAAAEDALDSIREIRGGDQMSRHGAGAAADLMQFYDDFAGLLQGWRNLLDREEGLKSPIRRRLVRAYLHRWGTWRRARRTDLDQAMSLLEANLMDDARDVRSLRDWMQVARFRSASLDRAAEHVSYALRVSSDRDVFFFSYVIAALQALTGREEALLDFKRKVDRSRERAASFGNSRFVYEWLAKGDGLGMLVNHSELRDWDRSAEGPDPDLLRRVDGRVTEIRRPQAGSIEVAGGIRAFFVPAVAGLAAGRDENARVSLLLGFAYEGPQAWSVRPIEPLASG